MLSACEKLGVMNRTTMHYDYLWLETLLVLYPFLTARQSLKRLRAIY